MDTGAEIAMNEIMQAKSTNSTEHGESKAYLRHLKIASPNFQVLTHLHPLFKFNFYLGFSLIAIMGIG